MINGIQRDTLGDAWPVGGLVAGSAETKPPSDFQLLHKIFGGIYPNGIPDYLWKMWAEPHRFYHGTLHLMSMLKMIGNPDEHNRIGRAGISDDNDPYRLTLGLAVLYHDIIYDTHKDDNEGMSAEFFLRDTRDSVLSEGVRADVIRLIDATKSHTDPKWENDPLALTMIKMDLYNLTYGTLTDMASIEDNIFMEYEWVDYALYKEGRLKFLEMFKPWINKHYADTAFNEYIEYFKLKDCKIAVYPGTFSIFHDGHTDIIRKAQKVFDKIIIARLQNPEKPDMTEEINLPAEFSGKQVDFHRGMLSEYVASKKYPVTIIKGLRNFADFESEKNQLRYMEDMDKHGAVNIAYFMCDRELEHVSSSAIKLIRKINPEEAKRYVS